MKFFDFLYYLIYKFYSGYKENGAESTSAGIIGGFQAMNILTLIMLINSLFKENTSVSKWVVIVLFIVFQVYTYFRYIYIEKFSIESIRSKWLSKSESRRKQIVIILFLYGALSIISCFGLATYLGLKNNS